LLWVEHLVCAKHGRVANGAVCYALNNRTLKVWGVPELRLPCRVNGIMDAMPNCRADAEGNDLDQAASRRQDESQSSVI
jgi:hypothetical protein